MLYFTSDKIVIMCFISQTEELFPYFMLLNLSI